VSYYSAYRGTLVPSTDRSETDKGTTSHDAVRSSVPDLVPVIEAHSALQKCLRESGSSTQASDGLHGPLQIPSSAAIEHFARASSSIAAFVSLVAAVNQLGSAPNRDRSPEAALELLKIALPDIHARAKKDLKLVTANEALLFNKWIKAHQGIPPLPEWFLSIVKEVEIFDKSRHLPGIVAYLKGSNTTDSRKGSLLVEHDSAVNALNAARKEDPGGSEALAAANALKAKEAEIAEFLKGQSPVDPASLEECVGTVGLSIRVNPEIVNALTSVHLGLGHAICRACGTVEDHLPETVECHELKASQDPKYPTLVVDGWKKTTFDAGSFTDPDSANSNLKDLLSAYAKTRSALVMLYRHVSDQDLSWKRTLGSAQNDLKDALSSSFPGGEKISRQVFEALWKIEDTEIHQRVLPILVSPIITRSQGSDELGYALDSPRNVALAGQTIARMISGSNEEASLIEKSLSSSALKPLVDFGMRVRNATLSGQLREVIDLFDSELKRLIRNDGAANFVEKVVVLQAMAVIAEDPKARRMMKGRLKQLDNIEDIFASINRKLEQGKEEAHYLENVRKQINSRFVPNLEDYFGQKRFVESISKAIETHLKLLDEPESWSHIPPERIISNTYLIHGPAGVGKTYGVECLATHFGLPRYAPSQESLGKLLKAGQGVSEDEYEKNFSQAIKEIVDEAQENRKKSGAKAIVLFLDEFEAYFMRRTTGEASHQDINRTNMKLRIFADLIRKNPEVLFFGATNNLQHVDDAGLRVGRFGVHFKLGLPEREDVDEILARTLELEEITLSSAMLDSSEYNNLADECVGITPQTIIIATNQALVLHASGDKKASNELFAAILERVQFFKEHDHREKKLVENRLPENGEQH